MSQDVVTAREVAGPVAGIVQLLDAQLICEKLDGALADEGFDRAIYSDSVQVLFQLAWAVAGHKRNRQVTIHHLAYALVFNHPEDGRKLAEYLGSDVDSFAVGCILQTMPLGVGDADILSPAVGTVRWLAKAVALANVRGKLSNVLPEDLVQAVLVGNLPPFERGALRKAAIVGNARRDAVLGPKSAPSIADAPSSNRDIIKHMEEVENGGAATGPTDDVAYLAELLEKLGERHSAYITDQKQAQVRVEAMIGRWQAPIEQPVLHFDDIMDKLGTIDRRVTAVHEALPRTPSIAGLAAAIVAVLTLGTGAGLALTLLQLQSPVAQAVSANAK